MSESATINALAKRLQKGDEKAGAAIFDRFATPFYRYFLSRTNQKEIAQDLVQEAFAKMLQNIAQFNAEVGNFSSWFWQIARNLLIDSFRQKKPVQSLEVMQETGFDVVDPNEQVQTNAEMQRVLAIADQLPEEERELFHSYFIADVSYADLAVMTGKSEANLRVMIHRLKKKISKIYDSGF
ncbi:MAG TPA: RNA polymerase sigma factor [Candidatus Paceibacterota bacterium]|nr:RNA polymerase sigma factor [Candidatus Paceibacterota bacterium]